MTPDAHEEGVVEMWKYWASEDTCDCDACNAHMSGWFTFLAAALKAAHEQESKDSETG